MESTSPLLLLLTCNGSSWSLVIALGVCFLSGTAFLAALEIRRRAKLATLNAEKWLKTALDLKKKLDDSQSEIAFERRRLEDNKRALAAERAAFERQKSAT